MAHVRERWLSRRALLLHAAILVWFPGCLLAFWWQVHRAFDGNGLSYVYSAEWPAFAVAGVWAWWQLLHTDPATVGRAAQERIALAGQVPAVGVGVVVPGPGGATVPQGARGSHGTAAAGGGSVAVAHPAGATPGPQRRRDLEDEELAAYNDRLAELAARGPKTWRQR